MTQSQSSDQANQLFAEIFKKDNLRGYDLVHSDQIINQIKNDSSQFTQLLISHQRGKQIVLQLMHITLMPQTFNINEEPYCQEGKAKNSNTFKQQLNKNATGLHQENKPCKDVKPQQMIILSTTQIYRALEILTNQYEQFVSFIFKSKQDNNSVENSGATQQETLHQEQLEDDCVIFQPIKFKKQQKKEENICYQILQKMFQLFELPVPIEETPCSYLVKIILPFSYQKPQQILKFICDKTSKYPKLICKHLYNSSIEELLMHVLQIQSNGEFFAQEKIKLLQIIIEQTFHYTPKQKFISEYQCEEIPIPFKQSNFSQYDQLRVQNYLLLLRSLFQKLEDKYQQEKYLSILKDTLNDVQNMKKIKGFFFYHLDFFHVNNLVLLFNMYLKMDAKCFQLYKLAVKPSNDFGDSHSFNKNQQSSICNYDLKLSSQVLNIIQESISKISTKQKWVSSSLRSSQYYELLYNWLVVTQKTSIITADFINICLSKLTSYKNNTILHNSIKNILVNYLPKIKNAFEIITSVECQLIPFIQQYLSDGRSQYCFQNQLYHICKTVLSIWEQNKLLKVMSATLEEQTDKNISDSVKENAMRIKSIKFTMEKKKIFYQKLICGDPRKLGEYQQEQSSEILMASSFKNFMRPSFQVKEVKQQAKLSRYQIGQQIQNLQSQNVNIFNSAISPLLQNNKIPSFTFEFDVLPLDSQQSEQMSEQDQENNDGNGKDQDMKLLQQNLDNFDMKEFKLNKILEGINSNQNQSQSLLSVDNYHRSTTSKSIEIIDIDNKQQEQSQDFGELRQNSNGPRLYEQNNDQENDQDIQEQFKVTTSQIQCRNLGIQSANGGSSVNQLLVSSKLQQNLQQEQTTGQYFTRHYSSYLQYNIDELCRQVE